MTRKVRSYSGTTSQAVSERELRNRKVARTAAADGIVLLQNDGSLPLKSGARVALFGSGATHTVKGGTGSGDVNEREVVNVFLGMKNAGFVVANEQWLADYDADFQRAREAWKYEILTKAASSPATQHGALIDAYFKTSFSRPLGRKLTEHEIAEADTDIAIYVLSRNAGEGADRFAEAGDYYLSEAETLQLRELVAIFPKMILVLNCGGPVDLSILDELHFSAVVHLSQPGMEGGNALADILSGKTTPSGKMTDTWANRYEDYPSSATFSHNNGNVQEELYAEGIYVGYRYFDTFEVKPRVPFGYGLSYTTFDIKTVAARADDGPDGPTITVRVEVVNSGSTHSGREVVQLYASFPKGELKKEHQRLCAFGKTPLLRPGERCGMELTFPLSQMASFSEKESAWVLEGGDYLVAVGNSSASNTVGAKIHLERTVQLLKTDSVCPLAQKLEEIEPPHVPQKVVNGEVIELTIDSAAIAADVVQYSGPTPEKFGGEAGELVESLSAEQLVALTSGDPAKGQDVSNSTKGSSDLTVPGAAGETHGCASGEPWNLASIVMADGPAGIRLAPHYSVAEDGSIIKPSFADSIEQGLFAKKVTLPKSTTYYQYCTAIPVGTMLAQSWDVELLREVGVAVASEMEEFGISVWLAPGMNIHRNPLCGRNFEYYSEDPLLAGMMASAITNGVQSNRGTGTTIKHLACNNQEDNRKHSNSVVSERALREIYLHGFEIAVKHSQPMAIMTSYNLINGVHTANSYDLITKVVRDEWGFAGFVMSDWTTTGEGGSSPVDCMKAGNDLIMPGANDDIEQIRNALSGSGAEALELKEVKKCAAHLVQIILQSNEYKESVSYAAQFEHLKPFMDCRILA